MTTSTQVLPAALADAIGEAVTGPHDPRERADLIGCVLREIVEALEWRVGTDPDAAPELDSLTVVLDACHAHRLRMEAGASSRPRR